MTPAYVSYDFISQSVKMVHLVRFTIFLLGLFPNFSSSSFTDHVRFEHENENLVNPKQKIVSDRDGRFLRFDTKDTEIELELGVSVPFLKIPLHAGIDQTPGAPSFDSRVAINPAGLLVGATLLLSTFLIVPLVFPSSGPGHARSDAEQTTNKGWAILNEAEDLLSKFNLDWRTCSKKAVCEMSSATASGALPAIMGQVMRLDFVNKALDGANLTNFIQSRLKDSCDVAFPGCFLSQKHLAYLPGMLGM